MAIANVKAFVVSRSNYGYGMDLSQCFDLLNCLPRDAVIKAIRPVDYDLTWMVLVGSSFFDPVAEGEMLPAVTSYIHIEKDGFTKRYEWRWCK